MQVKVWCFMEKYDNTGLILPLLDNSNYVLTAVMIYFDLIKSETNMFIP